MDEVVEVEGGASGMSVSALRGRLATVTGKEKERKGSGSGKATNPWLR